LRELLTFVRQHVPYFRERQEYAVEPERFHQLPLMRKAELRVHFPKGLVSDQVDVAQALEAGWLETLTTSGTTSERVSVLSDRRLPFYPPGFRELWGLSDFFAWTLIAVLTTPACMGSFCHLAKASYEERLVGQQLFLPAPSDLFSLSADQTRAILEEMHQHQPQLLFVNPFYLHWLGRRALELGLALPRIPLVLSCYQYLSRLQRRGIQALWGTRPFSLYSATDLGGCETAYECAQGQLHVWEEQTLVEVVDSQGLCPEGTLGALALTAVSNRVMPVLRYLIGDVGRLEHAACDCPLSGWPRLEIHGRMKDLMHFNGRWVTTRQVDEALGAVGGIDFYQATQTEADALLVQVIPALGATVPEALLMEALGDALGVSKVRVQKVGRLEPEPSLKFRLTGSRFVQTPELLT
jgi:phenylacetate-CoA ligase